MKEMILSNIGNIGGILLVVVILLSMHFAKQYNYEGKWVELVMMCMGMFLVVGTFVVGKTIFEWLAK